MVAKGKKPGSGMDSLDSKSKAKTVANFAKKAANESRFSDLSNAG